MHNEGDREAQARADQIRTLLLPADFLALTKCEGIAQMVTQTLQYSDTSMGHSSRFSHGIGMCTQDAMS